ncbi:MAG: bifunctional folylpolyglutamate synthase/dihydrofolate synthase [Alphaproteobacteria bacterium]|nr:bifunctional folylpolyglutamate synthase/dihydrofolate synthase [Alphaproteobacteria bacterium]
MHAADLHHPNRTLEDKLRTLYVLNRDKTVDLGFRRPYLDLLAAFGNPHEKLPPVIHVAGTNGKGSVIATLRAILEAAGLRVHVYTSPHLIRFNERIVLAGEEIGDGPLEALIDEALEKNGDGAITFFEITTAIAFAAFARSPADICLLEVGLGGRLDCTNVVTRPLATVITTISRDHQEFLGESLTDIAGEKAGIFKPGSPAVLGYQTGEGLRSGVVPVFESKARDRGIPLYKAGSDWSCESGEDNRMRFRFGERMISLPRPNLAGDHQVLNAGAALATLHVLPPALQVRIFGGEAVSKGLLSVRWPARLQRIGDGALKNVIPPGWEVYVDGGHNDSAGDVLAAQARNWSARDGLPLHILAGMLKKKDPRPFLQPLVPHAATLSAMTIPCAADESFTPGELAAKLGTPVDSLDEKTIGAGLSAFFARHDGPGRLLICGSLYLAGDVLATEGMEKIEKTDFLP